MATVYNARNEKVASFRTVESSIDYRKLPCPPGNHGVWKIVVEKAETGVLDDVWVQFGKELSGYVGFEPGKLLLVERRPR